MIDRANLPDDPVALLPRLTVAANLDTPFIVVTMTDKDPVVAAATANALADVLVGMSTTAPTDAGAGRDLLAVVDGVVPDVRPGHASSSTRSSRPRPPWSWRW